MVRHRAGVSCLAFAPDHQRLASGDSVKEVVIWDTVSREPLVTRLVYHSAKVLKSIGLRMYYCLKKKGGGALFMPINPTRPCWPKAHTHIYIYV